VKAISLWQPWATLVSLKLKTIETRTHGRFASLWGKRIAIHATKKFDNDNYWTIFEMLIQDHMTQRQALDTINSSYVFDGKILCTAQVVNARWAPKDNLEMREDWNKQALCEVSGKYCLFLGDIKILKKPIPYKGRQGIFEIPDEVINAGSN
jgi:hypothetical protein